MLVDVILGYDCNLWCDYCTITPEMRRRSLSTRAVLEALDEGRRKGYDRVSFTGGEPTIREDLLGLVRAARQRGYLDVKVQSNGLLFSHKPNVDKLVAAGANRFHVSIHTHDPALYDSLVRREGSYPLMVAGLENLRGLNVIADVILKSDTYRQLPEAIRWLKVRGVTQAHLWFVSLTDGNRDNLASMPKMTEVVPFMREAFREPGIELKSLHVPRCLLGEAASHAFDPGSEQVLVVTPEARFELKDSKLAGTVHVPACSGCEWEKICPGVRPDYLARFGDEEIAAARGQSPSRKLPLLNRS